MRLEGKVALITGGGGGIGAAIARRFAEEGASVHITGARMENTRQLTMDLREAEYDAVGRVLDVTDSRAVAATVAATMVEYGRLDILVANAALTGLTADLGPLLDITDADWRRLLEVNLSGVFYSAREAARVMMPAGRGSIIVIGAVDSFVPEPGRPASAAAKGGVLMLMKSLARDLGPYGVRVNGIAPGNIDTEKMAEAHKFWGVSEEEILARVPLERRGEVGEVASIATFLASDESSYVTGQMIAADGGQLTT
jgi:3-oxoacyl-[acyl-carrier protein] reductase